MRSISICIMAALTVGCASPAYRASECANKPIAVDREIRHHAREVTRLTSLAESGAADPVESATEGLRVISEIKQLKGACLAEGQHATVFVSQYEARLTKARDTELERQRAHEERQRLTTLRRQQVDSAQVLTTTPSLKVELVDFDTDRDRTLTVVRLTNLTSTLLFDTRLYRCDREPRRNIWGTRVDTCRHSGIELRVDGENRRLPISIEGPKSLDPGESCLITVAFPGAVAPDANATLFIRGVTHRGSVRQDLQASITFPANVARL